MKNVTLTLTLEQFEHLESIWQSRIYIGERIIRTNEADDLPPNINERLKMDRIIHSEIVKNKN